MTSLLPPGARDKIFKTLLDGLNDVRNAHLDAPPKAGAGPGPQNAAAGAGSGPPAQSVPQPAAAGAGPGSSFSTGLGPQAQSLSQKAAAFSANDFGRLPTVTYTTYQTQMGSPGFEPVFGRPRSPDLEDGYGRLGSPDLEDCFGRLQPLDKPVLTISDQIQEMKKRPKAELNAILTRSECGVFSERINHMPPPRARVPSLTECVQFIYDNGCGEARRKIDEIHQQGSGQSTALLFSHVCINMIERCMALKQAAEKSPDEVDPLHTHVGFLCEILPMDHDAWIQGVECLYSTANGALWDLCAANLHSYV